MGSRNNHNRYYIDHYNPQLFLALAGATDNPNGNYGEYWEVNYDFYDSKRCLLNKDKLNKQLFGADFKLLSFKIDLGNSTYYRMIEQKYCNKPTKEAEDFIHKIAKECVEKY